MRNKKRSADGFFGVLDNARGRRQKTAGAVARRILEAVAVVFLLGVAVVFLSPIVLTFTNSLMSSSELSSNYGKILSSVTTAGSYVAERVNLKLIPDIVSFSQYSTVLLRSPDYLLKFWNSVILVAPIVIFQVVVALGASYCFARFQTKFRSVVFFTYIILMLMPYQVTLVPNYLCLTGWDFWIRAGQSFCRVFSPHLQSLF